MILRTLVMGLLLVAATPAWAQTEADWGIGVPWLVLGALAAAVLGACGGVLLGRWRGPKPAARGVSSAWRGLEASESLLIIRRRPDGRITYASPLYCKLFGVERDDILGKAFYPTLKPTQEPLPEKGFVGVEARGFRLHYEQALQTVNGEIWVAWEDCQLTDQSGEVVEVQSIGRDITRQKEFEGGLERARALAERASRSKAAFLATMSHEIRTPMNGILGMTNLLLRTDLSEEQDTYATAVQESGDALLSLINDILDFSRIESGEVDLEAEAFDLRRTVESVGELLGPRAFEKGIQIATIVEQEVPHLVKGDEARLRQVLMNLVGNAVKFTESGGVTVRLSAVKGLNPVQLKLKVTDTGIGIPQAACDSVFDEFTQADDGESRRFGGMGLGLAITKRIVTAMNGEVGVESAKDKGSTFWARFDLEVLQPAVLRPLPAVGTADIMVVSEAPVIASSIAAQAKAANYRPQAFDTLAAALADLERHPERDFSTVIYDIPLDAEEPDIPIEVLTDFAPVAEARRIIVIAPEQRERLQHFLSSGFDGFLIKPVRQTSLEKILCHRKAAVETPAEPAADTGPSPAATTAGEPAKTEGPLRVLLAEDNEINALLVTALLEKQGHRVDRAINGREAVEAAIQVVYDAVLMDLHMPEVDGLCATREIRNLEGVNGKVPIIALTANVMSEDRKRCFAAGMDEFLPKPVMADDLSAVLDKCARGEGDARSARIG